MDRTWRVVYIFCVLFLCACGLWTYGQDLEGCVYILCVIFMCLYIYIYIILYRVYVVVDFQPEPWDMVTVPIRVYVVVDFQSEPFLRLWTYGQDLEGCVYVVVVVVVVIAGKNSIERENPARASTRQGLMALRAM